MVPSCKECPEQPECPECPDCPVYEILECPDGYRLEKSDLKWECIREPQSGDPVPKNYVALLRADAVLQWLESTNGRANHIFTTVRDPRYVVSQCGNCVNPVLGVTTRYLTQFANEAEATHRASYGNQRINAQTMTTPNRRCNNPDWPNPDWCKVTNIRQSVWREEWVPVETAMKNQIAEMEALVEKAGNHYTNASFDGLRHWCDKILAGELSCR